MGFGIRILDVIDIVLVALLLYQMYRLMRGTVAIGIFIGVLSIYGLWFVVDTLKMELLSSILGKVLGVGVLVIIIVFQQEIRKFLLYIGTRYFSYNRFVLLRLFHKTNNVSMVNIDAIVKAVQNMSETQTGALIVVCRSSPLDTYVATGDVIKAVTSTRLIENIFFKHSPLHDGAVIIRDEKIIAARCTLPVTQQLYLPPHYGMRHKAAIGLTEVSDAVVLVISEETGVISFVDSGKIYYHITAAALRSYLTNAIAEKWETYRRQANAKRNVKK